MFNIGKDKKRLLSNFLSLSSLQAFSMFLPLITLPYLVRVLGVETFGLVGFSLAIIMSLNILVSFGFELSATREISLIRDDLEKVSEIFSAVIIVKCLLLLLSFLILTFLVNFFEVFQEYELLYYVTFLFVVGNLFFPIWLYQGMENMTYIAYIDITFKVICTVLIFTLVQKESDFIYVPLLNSLASIFAGVLAFTLAFKLFRIRFVFPKLEVILLQVKNSYHFFFSRVANQGSRYYAITIIGVYFGNNVVGYYIMVEKLFFAFVSIAGIVSQAIYPYMSRTKDIQFLKKIFCILVIGAISALIPVIHFSDELLGIVFDVQNQLLSDLFLLAITGVVFSVASSIAGYPLLAAFGFTAHANNSLIYASVIYVFFVTISVVVFQNIYFVALSLGTYHLIVLIFRIYFCKKEGLI